MRTAPDRTIDAAAGLESTAAPAPPAPDPGERQANAVAANVLDYAFEAAALNRKWIADVTYIWTAEGWLCVAAVVELFSRRVVG